jgi:hypothetical protein
VFAWCSRSLLPRRQRPHPDSDEFGTPHCPGNATSTGTHFSGLQSVRDVQAPTLASPPGCTHRRSSKSPGRPGRLHHASPGWLPAPGCGIATCPTRATDTAGLSPAGLQPCRLLPESVGRLQAFWVQQACGLLDNIPVTHRAHRTKPWVCGQPPCCPHTHGPVSLRYPNNGWRNSATLVFKTMSCRHVGQVCTYRFC